MEHRYTDELPKKYFCNIKLMLCSGDLDASLVHVQSGVDQGLDDLRHELLGHV